MTKTHLTAILCGASLLALSGGARPTAAEDAAKSIPAADVEPGPKWLVYVLPHSHVDIGYTDIQPQVERKHWQFLDQAVELCRKTRAYPPGAQFKWNPEVVWAVDSYLRQATPEKRQRLTDAIRGGQVELHALYANELTGLCRPEELLRLMQSGIALGRRCGATVDAAMITDTPGCPWGMAPAMAQAGVKYCALGMNYCHRIGHARAAWEDKPFYWQAPDGKHKVLCWVPFMGYALGITGYKLVQQLPEHLAQLERKGYPYDIVQLHWCIESDNGPPDASLPELVKGWNAKHAYPKLIIATTSELFREFERRYADRIPVVSGDFTPYWEDGASSTARETAVNRTAAERLVQAETLWAMFDPREYPAVEFAAAWRNVILYDEHTWGAGNDIIQPDKRNEDAWKIHLNFALDADVQSRTLLSTALDRRGNPSATSAVDVFNTASWPRTDLVVLSKEMSAAGDVVTGPDGEATPSQRFSTGELAFLAKDVPALAGKRYAISAGKSPIRGNARAEGAAVSNPAVAVQVDPASGAVVSFRSSAAANAELCDMTAGVGLNRYYYVMGNRVNEPRQAGPATTARIMQTTVAKVAVKESGPLVASLLVESDAPGCVKFSREIRVVDGLDRVDIVNVLDKKKVREKESAHLGFAFNVPDGVMRMDIPWAVVRPEIDQIPGACKNWLPVGRWVDISNREYGVTWVTLDAPMAEVGGLTAERIGIGPRGDPAVWLDKLAPSQTLYSWVMNNYWELCFKADQEGPTTFRYVLLPHKHYSPVAAQRFGIECSQPLVVTKAQGAAPGGRPFLELDTPDVMVASIKPSNDRSAWIVRLFGAGGKTVRTAVHWGPSMPKAVWISNLAEDRGERLKGPVEVPTFGLVTLRAELP
jgi:alpha-mannosidase